MSYYCQILLLLITIKINNDDNNHVSEVKDLSRLRAADHVECRVRAGNELNESEPFNDSKTVQR